MMLATCGDAPHNGGVKYLGSCLFLISATIPSAFATPIVYTMTGYVQGSGGGQQVNTSFTWTVTADTSAITIPSPGHLQVPAVSNTMTFTGVGSTTISGVTVSLNTTNGQISFASSSGGLGFTSPALQTYNLAPLAPITGTNFLVGGSITTSDGTVITLTGVANANSGPSATFQAGAPPPTVTSVTNAASNILPGLPNAGIAQGAIFLLFGSGLGPASIAIAPAPFQSTTLSTTSVAVTVAGTTVNAPLYYTSDAQVAALLPSSTPAGTGTITVTFNGRTGPAAPITVVPNNVGIFTISSNGQGPGIVTYADYSLVSDSKAVNCGGPNTVCGAANPGDTLILWATGLGPVSGNDVTGAGLGQNMPNIPLKLWLGGVQAPVLYQGRSGCCVGEDQIVFTVPANVPTGCAVPLLIQINGQISNNTVMSVANGSRTCTPSNTAFAGAAATASIMAGAPITYAGISLSRDSNPNNNAISDDAKFQFVKILSYIPSQQPFFMGFVDDQPPGTCLVYNNLNPKNATPVGNSTSADAGNSFTVTGPNGSKVVTGSPGKFSATLSSSGTFLAPGAYTVTGTGGADIGAFSAAVTFAPTAILTNPALSGTPPVTRANGMTVTWNPFGGALSPPGSTNSYVQIQVNGALDNSFTNGATALCTVPAAAGTFTIPPYVLQAIPPSSFGSFQFQQLTPEAPFTGKGLDLGFLQISGLPNFTGLTLK
jgi:uncharacterized protein (TIGR03437 family)